MRTAALDARAYAAPSYGTGYATDSPLLESAIAINADMLSTGGILCASPVAGAQSFNANSLGIGHGG